MAGLGNSLPPVPSLAAPLPLAVPQLSSPPPRTLENELSLLARSLAPPPRLAGCASSTAEDPSLLPADACRLAAVAPRPSSTSDPPPVEEAESPTHTSGCPRKMSRSKGTGARTG
jgi:hypothetical protein